MEPSFEPDEVHCSPVDSSLEALQGASAIGDALRKETLGELFARKLTRASNVLILGVGGGNDSVSTLMVKLQLEKDFGFSPARLTIGAMLPDVMEYGGLLPVADGVFEIAPDSTRSIGGKPISAFPEPLLSAHRSSLGVDRVLGISMRAGSDGVAEALKTLLDTDAYDLVIACDVGGDFIAVPENQEVLSPMMDAYALHALKRTVAERPSTELICCVFGLGTDGESTPDMLRKALSALGGYESGELEPETVAPVETFYRSVVQLNRHSRTADFTFRALHGDPALDSPVPFRARFHTQPAPGSSKVHYGEFEHRIDRELAKRYFLFDDLTGVENPFALPCSNGIEWFLKIQEAADRPNHELNGQSYRSMEVVLGEPTAAEEHSLFFGTPSRKFTMESRAAIMEDTLSSISSGAYDCALVFGEDLPTVTPDGLAVIELNARLAIVTRNGVSLPVEALKRLL